VGAKIGSTSERKEGLKRGNKRLTLGRLVKGGKPIRKRCGVLKGKKEERRERQFVGFGSRKILNRETREENHFFVQDNKRKKREKGRERGSENCPAMKKRGKHDLTKDRSGREKVDLINRWARGERGGGVLGTG